MEATVGVTIFAGLALVLFYLVFRNIIGKLNEIHADRKSVV